VGQLESTVTVPVPQHGGHERVAAPSHVKHALVPVLLHVVQYITSGYRALHELQRPFPVLLQFMQMSLPVPTQLVHIVSTGYGVHPDHSPCCGLQV